MRKLAAIVLLAVHSVSVVALEWEDLYAAVGGDTGLFGDMNTGLFVFPMLLVPTGGRYEGMGTAFTAVADDSSFFEANPSASSLLDYTELSVTHNNWISDSSLEGVVYTVRFDELGIGAAGKFLYAPFMGYDDLIATPEAAAYYSESVATINVSYNFFSSYRFYGLAVGTNIKLAYRSVPDVIVPDGYDRQSALAAVADFGVLTRFNFLKPYPSRSKNASVGLVLKNLGPRVLSEALPTMLTAGIAYSPFRPVTVAWDVDLPLNYGLTRAGLTESLAALAMAGGVDVVFTDFFSMQAGFNYRGANPRVSLGAFVALPDIGFVVNYTLDLTTQMKPLDRISLMATLNLGDRGRMALRARVDELYLAGVEAYAEGKLEQAIEAWKEALEIDPEFEPAQAFLERAVIQLENRKKLETVR